MGLGTKNRQKQTADICKQHLREKYRDQLGLVDGVAIFPRFSAEERAKGLTDFNDLPMSESVRKFFWLLGRCPDDHAGLSELGL
jgi:hypothetical protein